MLLSMGDFSLDMSFIHPPGNPLEEKHSAEGDWRDRVLGKLPKLKKLDGPLFGSVVYTCR